MILKELNLISFGKFKNENIHLEEGLNIIYGENESGKTTIHNFIDGMFYGFLKPYAKIRNYSEEREKYRPWDGQDYRGIIKLSQFGKDYRIERNFHKGQVKIYDDLTGIDITKEIDMGEKLKDNLPGLYFFDFNNMVYNNTISIKQLETKVDAGLSKEVKDRLANISTSLDEDISVKNAISELDGKLDEIGTKKAYRKPYGMAINKLDDLKKTRKELLEKNQEYNEQIKSSLEVKKEIKLQEEKLEKLNYKFKQLEILDKKKNYEEAISIKSKLEEINKEIEVLKKYSSLSFEDYGLAVKLEKDLEYTNEQIEEIHENIKALKNRLKTLELEIGGEIVEGIDINELYSDLDTLEEMDEEKNHILLNREQNKLDILNSELKNMESKRDIKKNIAIIFIILTLLSIGLTFMSQLFFLFTPFFGILTIIFRNSHKKHLSEIGYLKVEIGNLTERENVKNQRLIYIENYQKSIFIKYNCNSKLELKKLKDDLYYKIRSSQMREDEIKKIRQELEDNNLELESKLKNLKESKYELNTILENGNYHGLEDYKIGLDKKKKYEDLILERENKVQILEKVLGDNTILDLEEEIKTYDMENLIDIDVDKNQLLQEIEDNKERLQEYLNLNSRLEERIENLNKYMRQIIEIEEEIERLEKNIENYENQIKSINIAKKTIQNISKDLHQQFAPSINKNVSEIINIVSDGKYNEIKIDEELNISIENPYTQEIISIDSLSGGTIDQLYFALRFSIISSIQEETLPLILDDCFVQYDDERLRNILEYLYKVALDKQIILFTCHHREMEILNKLDIEYNLIKLLH